MKLLVVLAVLSLYTKITLADVCSRDNGDTACTGDVVLYAVDHTYSELKLGPFVEESRIHGDIYQSVIITGHLKGEFRDVYMEDIYTMKGCIIDVCYNGQVETENGEVAIVTGLRKRTNDVVVLLRNGEYKRVTPGSLRVITSPGYDGGTGTFPDRDGDQNGGDIGDGSDQDNGDDGQDQGGDIPLPTPNPTPTGKWNVSYTFEGEEASAYVTSEDQKLMISCTAGSESFFVSLNLNQETAGLVYDSVSAGKELEVLIDTYGRDAMTLESSDWYITEGTYLVKEEAVGENFFLALRRGNNVEVNILGLDANGVSNLGFIDFSLSGSGDALQEIQTFCSQK